jgi:hypothetical protein
LNRREQAQRARKLAAHLIQCAALVYGNDSEPIIIEKVVTWTIGDLTIMIGKNNDVYVAGRDWRFIFKANGAIQLTGTAMGDAPDQEIMMRYRELLALIIGVCTIEKGFEGDDIDVRIYAGEPKEGNEGGDGDDDVIE